MSRSLTFALSSLLVASQAAAHGPPPAALAPLAWDAHGVQLVQLSLGLALRSAGGFRFVCPEAWGGDAFAPVGAIPGGSAVVAARQLYLLDDQGRAAPHPEVLGEGIALANNEDALFGLFWRDGHTELRRVYAAGSTLLHTFDEPFKLLAARQDTLSVMYIGERSIEVQHLTLDGTAGARVSWSTPNTISYAELQATGGQLYARLYGNTAPWVTLVRVDGEGYELLDEAQAAIAGPVSLPEGELVALDGRLQTFDDARAPVAQGAGNVNVLGRFGQRAYACDREGLKELSRAGVGATLFELAALHAPDPLALPEPVRADCAFRWRDVQEHVAQAQLERASPDAGATDAAPEAESTRTGCALGGNIADGWLAGLALLWLSRRRR